MPVTLPQEKMVMLSVFKEVVQKIFAPAKKENVAPQSNFLKSEQVIVGASNTRTPQETQEFLKNTEAGRALGVSHLFK